MEPVGAIRGDKNIAHSPPYGSRTGPRRSGISAGGLVFPGIFFRPSRAGQASRTRRPASHTMGGGAAARKKRERSKKLASGAVASLCRFRDFVPTAVLFRGGRPGAVLAGACLRAAVWQRFRSRRTAAEIHRGNRPPGIRKGPRKTGALADVDLSGPQAWDVPVRAASRTGDQPAGRPARRAPGSCRCCDRW